MAKKKYKLTQEHQAQLKPWADKWIANAMSTKAMDDADREAMTVAVEGLYLAANLTPPPRHRIVFVPSPFVLRIAGGFAAAIWYARKTGSDATEAATEAATWDATLDATLDATEAATRAATEAATWDATLDATLDATEAATRAATLDATLDATEDVTRAATWDATRAATEQKTWFNISGKFIASVAVSLFGKNYKLALQCSVETYRMWQGGNQWSGYDSYLSFFRHVAKLPIDYSKYQHWESAAVHGGPRIMHPEFCMISDRPEILLVDDQNRPHCETGPFCKWRDGTALYAVHGVRVPWDIIEDRKSITVARIDTETNAEVRRVMINLYGAARYMQDAGATMIDSINGGSIKGLIDGKLWRREVRDDEPIVMVELENSTPEPDGSIKRYWLRVPPATRTVQEAVAWTFDVPKERYQPVFES